MKKVLSCLILLVPYLGITQLSGYWKSDTGGCYQITQNGHEVYWAAEEGDQLRANNVFSGTLFDQELCGTWCDLPSHSRSNCGERIVLRIENKNRMVKSYSSVSYKGSIWTKQSGPCGAGGNQGGNNNYDLSTCFKKTPNTIIEGFNIDSFNDLSLNECKQKCLDDPQCKSIDYKFTKRVCYTQFKDLDDADKSKVKVREDYDHYKNICR